MHAIVTAGGTPSPKDPLFPLTGGLPKALLPVAGKPMIQWVMDALSGTEKISEITTVGLPPAAPITSRHPLTFLPDHGGIIENIRAGVEQISRKDPDAQKTLIISSDIPAITSTMVEWMVKLVEKTEGDLFYNVISRPVMEAAFPGSKRTYTRLRQLEVCGGDLNAISLAFLAQDNPFFHEIIDSRKNPLKQGLLFGMDIMIGLLLNRLSLEDVERKISARIHARGKAIICPYAEIGMDVDKPHQFEMVQSYMLKRSTI